MASSPHRLPLVAPGQELTGHFPRGFERTAKSCESGDALHHALIFASATVAQRGLEECLAPGARGPYQEALDACWRWGRGSSTDLRGLRARCFDQVPEAEAATLKTIDAALERLSPPPLTALSDHAEQVRKRYLGLAVHHAAGAVVQLLDATRQARGVLPIAGEVSGAIAYKRVALGPCRNPELQSGALEQAAWEHVRVGASQGHTESALALQRWHEYLGVHWKNLADAQRLHFEEFLAWVFTP